MHYYLVEVRDSDEYLGTWCCLAETAEEAEAEVKRNVKVMPFTLLKVMNLHAHGWTTPVQTEAPFPRVPDVESMHINMPSYTLVKQDVELEAAESRQLVTLSLLKEAQVKLEAQIHTPYNLTRRIDEHMRECSDEESECQHVWTQDATGLTVVGQVCAKCGIRVPF